MSNTTRPTTHHLDLESVRHKVEVWFNLKKQVQMLTKTLEQGKEQLKELVQENGITDPDSGSLFLDLQGAVGDRKIAALKNQRRTVYVPNMKAAERILKRKGLWEQMTRQIVITEIDQDAVNAAFFDKKITKTELDTIFRKDINYSFITLDVDNKPVS